jgi:hypothetical protein
LPERAGPDSNSKGLIMDRRLRPARACAALLCALVAGLATAAQASAYQTSELTDWDMFETLSTYGSPTQFHIATGTDGAVSFRWLDVTDHTTVNSANACSDLSLLGSSATVPAGNTSYHLLFTGFTGQCFELRGRTAAGSGSMFNKDGRVQR